MGQLLRVQNFTVSSDGFGAGAGQSATRPFGHASPAKLMAWAMGTQGWWGDEPPFHTPVFVLTHHARPSFTLSDTTFHFVDGDPAAVLGQAKDAAQGKDVRLGGGVTTVREFLDAGLVDALHIAVAPLELGSGERLWKAPEELEDRYAHEVVPSPSGVKHHLFWRTPSRP